jgi:tripartite-type tricarboxylate transporter receptor subunit TctC
VARLLADGLARRWGQPVVVENRPGGNGFIAIDAFKRAPQDGSTLIVQTGLRLSAYPSLFKNCPTTRSAAHAADGVVQDLFFHHGSAEQPLPSVGALVADTLARPGQLNYGS